MTDGPAGDRGQALASVRVRPCLGGRRMSAGEGGARPVPAMPARPLGAEGAKLKGSGPSSTSRRAAAVSGSLERDSRPESDPDPGPTRPASVPAVSGPPRPGTGAGKGLVSELV